MADESHTAPQDTALFDAFRTSVEAGEACAAAYIDIQQELLKYAVSGLHWNTRTLEALAACTNLSEIAEIQNDWMDVATRRYFDSAARMTQIAMRTAEPFTPSPPPSEPSDSPAHPPSQPRKPAASR